MLTVKTRGERSESEEDCEARRGKGRKGRLFG